VGLGTAACPGSVEVFSGVTGTIEADTGLMHFTGRDAFNNVVYTGTLDEIVLLDSATHALDFIYEVTNDVGSMDAIGRVSDTNYMGQFTDVGVDTSQAIISPPGTLVPGFISRGVGGDNVTFDFGSEAGGMGIAPGVKAADMIIKTHAVDFGGGSTAILDGGIAAVQDFAPVPEPMNAGLLLAGLFGAGLFVARKYRVSQN
jgi:hypothetical protein